MTNAYLSSPQKSPPSTIPHKAESSSIPQDDMQCQAFFDFILSSWNQFMTPEELASSADLDNEDRLRIGTGLLFQAHGPLLKAEKKVSTLEADNRDLPTEVATRKDAVAKLVLTLKTVKSLEAEIPTKTAQALEKEYDRGVNDCRNFIFMDNAIAKMDRKEEDSMSLDKAITKSNQTEEEGDQVEKEGNQVKEKEYEDEDEDEEDKDEDEEEEKGIY
ncbi:hypothetical protein ACOSQ4_004614 [Xanthoceras sorbifolium]